mmetsp:Transcript_61536/g.98022  ORF Transcript_61536/g.98022 Transcript_61536/m.98022 type:complete len:208 (-) Transcript_61536:2-625(-)
MPVSPAPEESLSLCDASSTLSALLFLPRISRFCPGITDGRGVSVTSMRLCFLLTYEHVSSNEMHKKTMTAPRVSTTGRNKSFLFFAPEPSSTSFAVVCVAMTWSDAPEDECRVGDTVGAGVGSSVIAIGYVLDSVFAVDMVRNVVGNVVGDVVGRFVVGDLVGEVDGVDATGAVVGSFVVDDLVGEVDGGPVMGAAVFCPVGDTVGA